MPKELHFEASYRNDGGPNEKGLIEELDSVGATNITSRPKVYRVAFDPVDHRKV